jgi:hypothetical protein
MSELQDNSNKISIIPPNGYEIDEENSTFSLLKFKKKEESYAKSWYDLKKIEGYYVSAISSIHNTSFDANKKNRNVFVTKEQAEACIAMAMLSQFMKQVNGDWVPDWNDESEKKYCICIFKKAPMYSLAWLENNFLSFEEEKKRDEFLKTHYNLIMKAAPLL